ncbi:MAG: leucyl aminopeptidase [Advenella sp.]|uniref:leucyl aminopeptidase n=1 Tax=Advenella sp. TaxID=1872388 RepID=UPI0025833487|nr:leucyl aminopeptidase [Advenella sp.]MDD3757259.1 leucyl aminopeptidase [Advenella sp.]
MEFNTQSTRSLQQLKAAALFIGVYTDGQLSEAADIINRASYESISTVLKKEFKAAVGSILVLRNLEGVKAERVILVGLGKKEDYNANALLKAHAGIAAYCIETSLTDATSTLLEEPCQELDIKTRARLAARAIGNALYQYDGTFSMANRPTPYPLKKITFITERKDDKQARMGAEQGAAIANGMIATRQLGNLPANICTPTYLGEQAKMLAKEFKSIKAEVLEKKQIEALKMGSFLSVAAGSDQPPRFIVLKYTAANNTKKDEGPIVLVGKGVTFDTGGISLKPGLGMDEMKFDMCGAASVFGVLRAIAEIGLTRDVIGIIPATENMPNGKATKPGDVITSMSGQTIEVLNTDAEGRLILCDALTYAERFKPSAVIDIATLTGACVVALGHVNSGLFASDDTLAEQLLAASKQAQDPAWRLPLDDAYQEQLKSNFADMANIGGMPAGSVTAACFLSRFTKAYRWAHLDIAGTAWNKGKEKGASGRPVPLLTEFLLAQQD